MSTCNKEFTHYIVSTDCHSSSSKTMDSDNDSYPSYPCYDETNAEEEYPVHYEERIRGKNYKQYYSLFDKSLLKGAALVREQLLAKEPLLQNTTSTDTSTNTTAERQKYKYPIETKKSRNPIRKILCSPKSVIPADDKENIFCYSKISDSNMAPSLAATDILNLHEYEAYLHACRAGKVWQSLIGQFIRFPDIWKFQDTFCSTPSSSTSSYTNSNQWKYISRSQIRASKILNELVPTPSSSGRILLHISVKDSSSLEVSQEFVIGVSHPKFILNNERTTADDDTRLVWMALREKNVGLGDDRCTMLHGSSRKSMSLLRPLLGKGYEDGGKVSPLGNNKNLVGNHNIRTIFGAQPPMKTIIIKENTLYEILMNNYKNDPTIGYTSPAILLVNSFLFD